MNRHQRTKQFIDLMVAGFVAAFVAAALLGWLPGGERLCMSWEACHGQ